MADHQEQINQGFRAWRDAHRANPDIGRLLPMFPIFLLQRPRSGILVLSSNKSCNAPRRATMLREPEAPEPENSRVFCRSSKSPVAWFSIETAVSRVPVSGSERVDLTLGADDFRGARHLPAINAHSYASSLSLSKGAYRTERRVRQAHHYG